MKGDSMSDVSVHMYMEPNSLDLLDVYLVLLGSRFYQPL